MRLLLLGHGTRDPAGRATIEAIAAGVSAALPGVRSELGWLDLLQPAADALAPGKEPTALVPLLLGTGFHMGTDLPRLLTLAPPGSVAARPLIGHRGLIDAAADRVRCAVTGPDGAASQLPASGAVVLVAAGSSSAESRAGTAGAAAALGERLGVPVRAAYASGPGKRPEVAVAELRELGKGPVLVQPWLIAEGRFARRLGGLGDGTGGVLGAHPGMIAAVADSYREARST